MKPQFRKHLITVALLAGLGAAAYAQTPPPAAAAPSAAGAQAHGRHHFDPARMAERFNRRLDDLKQKLQLNANQQSAWTSYTSAIRPNLNRQRPDREAIARMSTPDRLDHLRALREQRNAEMDRRAEATKAFYNQLTAEQKKTFDAQTMRGGRGHRHGPGGHGKPHQG